MKHYSPSNIGSISLCARYTPDDVSNEAADNGTLFHNDLESIIAHRKPSEYEEAIALLDRSDDHKTMLREALQQAGPLLCLGLPVIQGKTFDYESKIGHIEPGVYVECSVVLWPDDRKKKVGRIDCLVVPSVGNGIIVDWKSNVVDVDFSWQLDSYASALSRLCKEPWKQLTGKIVAPNLDVHEDIVYDEAALKRAERRIYEVEERANNPFTPPCPGERQCKYCRCKRLGQCPAIAEYATSKHPENTTEMVADPSRGSTYLEELGAVMRSPRILLKPDTLEERALRRDWYSVVSMILDYIKEDDKAYFQSPEHSSETLPGHSVSTRLGNRQADKTRLMELNRRLMSAFGLDYDRLLACLEPNKELLLEQAALAVGSRKTAEERYSEVVDSYSVRGAPITTVRRSADRKLVKIKATGNNQQ